MSGEGALPYVSPLESFRLRSLPGFADPPRGRGISTSLNGIAVKGASTASTVANAATADGHYRLAAKGDYL